MNEILYLMLVAFCSVVALFVIAKLLGKRQISQLEFVDYIIGISIGSISAEMATDIGDKPMYYYLIALAIYFLFDVIINLLGRTSPFLKHFLKGRPLVIIYDGKINYANLNRSKLSINDVISMAREQGYFDISKIKYAVFENSGKLSIMPVEQQQFFVAQDFDLKKPSQLPFYVVTDGRISFSTLNELQKDKTWLLNKLNIKEKELKNIILAIYDNQTDQIAVHTKQ